MATERRAKESPSWNDVKAKVSEFDAAGIVALVHDLYSSSKENRAFLHARFGLGTDSLKLYKVTIARWLWPDISRGQETSISKAKKALADYKKAIGRPEELAELMTFYCEQASGFCREVGFSDESFSVSLIGVFTQALKLTVTLSPVQRDSLLIRLDEVSRISHDFGYGVGDEMDDLLDAYDLPLDDLHGIRTSVSRERYSASAKYRNPESGDTWSGRGRVPLWLTGKNKEDFRIK